MFALFVTIISVILIILILIIYWISSFYKTYVERILFMSYMTLLVMISIVLTLDNFNIPTKLGILGNIHTETWMNGFFAVIASLAGSVALFVITKWQIDENNRINIQRDQEEKRISHMPLLKYEFNNKAQKEFTPVISKYKKGNIVNLTIVAKNLGQGIAQDCCLTLYELCEEEIKCSFTNYSIIEQNCQTYVSFLTNLPDGMYDFVVKVSYHDILENEYEQFISLKVTVSKHKYLNVYFDPIIYKVEHVNDSKIIKKTKKCEQRC